ncbi:hypothetical protein ILUMI_16034, partial [Ignelater luminosus]
MEHKAGPILSLTSFWLAAIGGRRLLQGGCTPEDKRGKQKSGNALKALEIISVMEHISLFPTKKTHYGTREHNYLDAELNVDVCNDCETLSLKLKNKSLNDTVKRVAAAELLVHKRRSKKFYNVLKALKELCRTQDNIDDISFDFMQNLQLFRCPVQNLFYLSHLTINVFRMHNMRTNNAVFFMYHEGQAKKSPNEISEGRNLLSYPWAFIFAFRLWADKAQVKENRQNLYINGIHGADMESSGRSVPRNPKEHFNISKYHYFLFSRDSGKGVVVGKDFIEGAITNTFSLLLTGVLTTKMQVDLAIPNEKVPISMKKWITSKSLTHLYM